MVKEAKHRACRVLKVLGNPVRYQLFRLLGEEGEGTSAEFAAKLNRNQPNITQHLAKMKKQDLVASKRKRQTVTYSIKRPDIHDLVCQLEERLIRET